MELIDNFFDIEGIIICKGIVIGNVCHYQENIMEQTAIYHIDDNNIPSEIKRFKTAINKSKEQLEKLAKSVEEMIGKNEASIFGTHILILDDPVLVDKIENLIKEKWINTEFAVKEVFEEYENLFLKMDDEYMRERAEDFIEIKKRIISNLTNETGQFRCNIHGTCISQYSRIVLAKEMTPSLIATLQENQVKGIITAKGGKNSHAAIIARSLNIPYLSGVKFIDHIGCGTKVILDADIGKAIFNPESEQVSSYEEKISQIEKRKKAIASLKGPIAKTQSAKEVTIYANAFNLDDIEPISKLQLAGIGLFRTEFLFYESPNFPGLIEQKQAYLEILRKAAHIPVTFRLFDFGGDKQIKTLDFQEEENPLLGLRGIRYLLKNKDLLITQLTALAEAAQKRPLKLMYPMISCLDELEQVHSITKEIIAKYQVQSQIEIGMMFEVPSVFINPEPFFKKVDFGSIGSNDLLQYLFGIDRNNPDVSYLYHQNHQQVILLIEQLVKVANKLNKSLTICGEIGEDPQYITKLINVGVKNFSISPSAAQNLIGIIKELP
ncbi:MAG: phosphoenolpyruvate--protein phosphotransferase [Spirochaetes bacterium]|nr:phosphoenolpyruvate--protein phosphotransferase [Spirochaetota bacterium]